MLKNLSKPYELACLLFIAGACVLSPGCAKPPPPLVKEKPLPTETNPTPDTAAATSIPNLPAPEPAEVNHAIERVFKGVVIVETGRNPYFTVGDFNGDFSQDLAVAVKPAPGKLPEINDELANWILVAPVRLAKPGPKGLPYAELHTEAARRRPVRVAEGDVLLAVVHGFQSKGWRDPQATQTYVLKGAAGAKMRVLARKQIVWAGNEEKLPRLWGDVIEQTISEQSGFLYYNGAKYAWYDPRTYQPAPPGPPRRMAHGRASGAMR